MPGLSSTGDSSRESDHRQSALPSLSTRKASPRQSVERKFTPGATSPGSFTRTPVRVGFGSTEPLRYGTDFRAARDGEGELTTATLSQRRPSATAARWIHDIGKI